MAKRKTKTPKRAPTSPKGFVFEITKMSKPVISHSKSPKILYPDQYKLVEKLQDGDDAVKFLTAEHSKMMKGIRAALEKEYAKEKRKYSIRMIDNIYSGIWRDDASGKKRKNHGNRYYSTKDKT